MTRHSIAARVQGRHLNMAQDSFGWLEPHARNVDPRMARRQIGEVGGLLIRGLVARERVEAAAQTVRSHLALYGTGRRKRVWTELSEAPAMVAIRRDPILLAWFASIFEEVARSLDHSWVRSVPRGDGTAPHCDLPYMARGTDRLLTMWLPLEPVDIEDGPLAILSGSHHHPAIRDYCTLDADQLPRRVLPRFRHGRRVPEAKFSRNAEGCRREIGGRWLTARFEPGDALVFSARTLHCSLDNASTRVRLSVDMRFQPAAEPCDPKWADQNRDGHDSSTG